MSRAGDQRALVILTATTPEEGTIIRNQFRIVSLRPRLKPSKEIINV